jgi:NAD(P)-dependent dehydrogenase (short-subunit alcohol dehydrogenase family)
MDRIVPQVSGEVPRLFAPACLAGKVALVTGASSGLGAHFALLLAGAGAEVILAARREAALAEVADAISAAGGCATSVRLDVTDAASIANLALERVDILINNAGLVIAGPALAQGAQAWDEVMDTNLRGMFLLAQAACQAMRERGAGGSIVNIASILGLRQAGGVLPYAVSKAGAIQLTKVLALEVARFGIRVNALAPGYIETDLNKAFWQSDAGSAMLRRIPQRRLGRLEDLDGPLLLLASDAGAYITGTVLTVDGGHMVSSL